MRAANESYALKMNIIVILFLKQKLPNGVIEMSFCIKTSSNTYVIRTVSYVSVKACVIVLPRGRVLWLFAYDFCSLFCPEGGWGFRPLKKFPKGSAREEILTPRINVN